MDNAIKLDGILTGLSPRNLIQLMYALEFQLSTMNIKLLNTLRRFKITCGMEILNTFGVKQISWQLLLVETDRARYDMTNHSRSLVAVRISTVLTHSVL